MIRLSDTYVEYNSGVRALNGVSLEIRDGEFVFIVGPSGAGKSTLIRLLTAELRPDNGLVLVNQFSISNIRPRQIPKLRRTIGVVYQDFKLIDRMTVFENIAFAMRVIGVSGRKRIEKRVGYVLELVGMADKANQRPAELSGGEQQRAAIARALVNNPAVIIADEPTGNLDPTRAAEIIRLLTKINALGTTVLVITHARELVSLFPNRVIVLEQGRVVGDGMRNAEIAQ